MEIAWRCEACGIGSDVHAPRCPGCSARGGLQRVRPRAVILARTTEHDDGFDKAEDFEPLDVPRASTGIPSLDTVFGKNETGKYAGQTGLALQGVTLLAGVKGLGKSALLFEMLARFLTDNVRCVFLASEQEIPQIRGVFIRLGLDSILRHLSMFRSQDFNAMMAKLSTSRAQVVVLDSLNATVDPSFQTKDETLMQVHIAERIYADAWDQKRSNPRAWVVVSQMTSDGKIAGREKLLHLVDTIPVLEADYGNISLSCPDKTRFARAGIKARFRMDDQGKMREVVSVPAETVSLASKLAEKIGKPEAPPIVHDPEERAVFVRNNDLAFEGLLARSKRRAQ